MNQICHVQFSQTKEISTTITQVISVISLVLSVVSVTSAAWVRSLKISHTLYVWILFRVIDVAPI